MPKKAAVYLKQKECNLTLHLSYVIISITGLHNNWTITWQIDRKINLNYLFVQRNHRPLFIYENEVWFRSGLDPTIYRTCCNSLHWIYKAWKGLPSMTSDRLLPRRSSSPELCDRLTDNHTLLTYEQTLNIKINCTVFLNALSEKCWQSSQSLWISPNMFIHLLAYQLQDNIVMHPLRHRKCFMA